MDQISAEEGLGLTRGLAEFTVSFTLDKAPERAVENAKTIILDCFGVSVLATAQEIGAAVLRFAEAAAAPGPCSVWGTRVRASARDAVLLNGTLAHGLDFDDANHSSTYSLAAPAALAERDDLPGARLLESFIVAREVRNCLDGLFVDRNAGQGPGAKGWHSNGVLGPIASACGAAKSLDLDIDRTLAAIGLAAGSCGALTRDGGTMAKPFRTGHAAAAGLTSALLAQSGFSSDDTVLEGRYGFLEALGPLPDGMAETLGANLGRVFDLESEVRAKRYAACWASQGGLEAMLRLVGRHAIEPNSVAEIASDLKPYPLLRRIPARGIEGRFSMPFCLALALVRGDVSFDGFTDANVADPAIRDLMERTRHVPDASALTVTLKDGRVLTEPLTRRGSLKTREEIAEKFRRCVGGVLPGRQAERIIGAIGTLETLASVRALTAELRRAAESEAA
jgi:2-methylcitrate dehydratase PrpD